MLCVPKQGLYIISDIFAILTLAISTCRMRPRRNKVPTFNATVPAGEARLRGAVGKGMRDRGVGLFLQPWCGVIPAAVLPRGHRAGV